MQYTQTHMPTIFFFLIVRRCYVKNCENIEIILRRTLNLLKFAEP